MRKLHFILIIIFILLLGSVITFSCSQRVGTVQNTNQISNGSSTNTNSGFTNTNTGGGFNIQVSNVYYTNLTSANYSSFPITLAPYEVKVVYISNLGKSGAIDTDPSWYLDAVFYQIFVRSFYDSDGNGIGDLNGVIQKLDYITNIGFNAIWLLPIFESPSYHGYDAVNYYSVESDYGNLTSFQNLVSQSHSKGVKVILDMVLNHTSSSHQWFIDSRNNANGKGNWYVWTNASLSSLSASGWQSAWGGGDASSVWHWDSTKGMYYYGAFSSVMPDLNLLNSSVSNEMLNIASNWIAKGVDGYRLDAVRYLIETGPYPYQADTLPTKIFLQAYNSYIKSINPNSYTVGEVWENNGIVSGYYGRLDNCFNFDFAYSVRMSIINQDPSYLVNMINTKDPSVPWKFFAPFLDNHDDVFFNGGRFADQVGGDWKKQFLAAGILMTFPGTPYIYYGTEIGMMKGSQGGDLGKRTPMQWNNTSKAGFTTGTPWTSVANNSNPYNVSYQLNDTNSLLNYYRKLISVRKKFSSLRRGEFKLLSTSDPQVLSYIRIGTNESVLVVANFSSSSKSVNVDFSNSGLSVSSTYSTYIFSLTPENTSNITVTTNNQFIQIDGIKDFIWNSCKVSGPITNTSTETLGWDFGGFLGLYITNDSTNIYFAIETPSLAGQYGNTMYIAIDLPNYSYNSTSFTNTTVLGNAVAKNILLTNNLYYDFILFMYAPSNSFVGQPTNSYVVWASGNSYLITNIGGSVFGDVSTKFVEISIPLSYLGLNLNDSIRVFGFFSGDYYPATAYCAIPFYNSNNSTTGGTSGPLPPSGSYNAQTILDDYLTYTVK